MHHRVRLFAILFIISGAGAQVRGNLEGTVLDPSHAPISSVRVEATNTDTDARRSALTDSAGHYYIPNLTPGRYSLSASAPGFRTATSAGIEIPVSQTMRVDVTLEVGGKSDAVTVSATEEPLIISASAAEWGEAIPESALKDAPLNGRDLFDLAARQGASVVTNINKVGLSEGFGTAMSLNGGRPNQIGFSIDGIHINDATGFPPASAGGGILGLESVQELAVVTSPFSAIYTRAAAGAVTAISKSAGNDWHGSGYEFLRNNALDARNFFDTSGGSAPIHRNQFGGMVGGPIRKDKLFLLVNPEFIRQTQADTESAATPSATARQGLLPGPNGTTIQVPVAPAVQPYLNLYPLPTGRDYGDGTGAFVSQVPSTATENFVAVKLDAIVSPRLRTATRYTFDNGDAGSMDSLHIFRFAEQSRYQFVNTDTQFLQSANLIHNLRIGVNRLLHRDMPTADVPASLSFLPGEPMGIIRVTGLADMGASRADETRTILASTDFQANYEGSYQRGRHSLRFGAGDAYTQTSPTLDIHTAGFYLFPSLASFLAGKPLAGDVALPGSTSARTFGQQMMHAFVQYENRSVRNLTLSAGLLYEPYTAPGERYGRVARLSYPIQTAQLQYGGTLFRNPSRANLAPRLGLAWNPAGSATTVIRVGFGLFFDDLGPNLFITNRSLPPWQFSRVSPLFPPFPNLLAAALTAPAAPELDAVDYETRQPKILQEQFTIERQLGAHTVVKAGYAGSRGLHLAGYIGNVNPATPQVQPAGQLFFAAKSPSLNPAFGRVGMERTQFDSYYYSGFVAVEHRWSSGLRFQARYTHARSIDNNSSDFYKDFLNSDFFPSMFNYRANRARSDFSVADALGATFSYALPLRARGAAGVLVTGWQASGVFQAQSGLPFNPRVGFDQTRLGTAGSLGDLGERPDAVAGVQQILGSPDRYFNPAAFALPAAGYYGNAGRNLLTGPGLLTLDLSLAKRLYARETQTVTLRLESFNIANRTNFQIPSALALFNSDGSRIGAAGQITQTSTPARQMQVALRWAF